MDGSNDITFAYTLEDLTLSLENDNDSIKSFGKEVAKQECSTSATTAGASSLKVKTSISDKKSSPFDLLLTSLWDKAMTNGLFMYKLQKNCLPIKLLPGRFNYIAQLNPDRAEKRRKPQEICSVNQPFNPDDFHFNKVDAREVLLRLEPPWSSDPEIPSEHLLLINVSPLEYGHVLLTPFRNECRPQNLSREGLRLALELVLVSDSCDFRVGFNSLCGYASVNHEHYHAYYLSHRLFIEHAPLLTIPAVREQAGQGTLFQLQNPMFPPGFCAVLTDLSHEGMNSILNSVMTLAAFFQSNDIGHNVYVTRGSTKNTKGHFDSIRIFVWARKSSFGAKECDAFNPALCELAGHFPIKSVEAFVQVNEQFILKELHAICDEPFQRVLEYLTSN